MATPHRSPATRRRRQAGLLRRLPADAAGPRGPAAAATSERFELVEFPEATSRRSEGPYDVLLVEGSVSTPEQAEEIVHLRSRTRCS